MRVKKYVAQSLPEAMKQIKHDLGTEAMIVDTKKMRQDGWLGFFKKKQIEVIAAVDHRQQVQAASERQALRTVKRAQWREPYQLSNQARPLGTKERKDEHKAHAHDGQLLGEIQHLKRIMFNMATENKDKLPRAVQQLDDHYLTQGCNEHVRSELLQRLLQKMDVVKAQSSFTTDEIHSLAYQVLDEYVGQFSIFGVGESSVPKMICFAGPTGVGKTTTIAKLAAYYQLHQQLKVGLMTCDTYRIAAVEQLKVYADILQTPLEIVYSPGEARSAYERMAECDIVLMDTAGRNYRQKEYIEELKQYIWEDAQLETFLVLSLTGKDEDVSQIIHNFRTLSIDALVLTKLDETQTYGSILNLLQKHALPLKMMTNGQDVPDDLIHPGPDVVARLIWGEAKHERSSSSIARQNAP